MTKVKKVSQLEIGDKIAIEGKYIDSIAKENFRDYLVYYNEVQGIKKLETGYTVLKLFAYDTVPLHQDFNIKIAPNESTLDYSGTGFQVTTSKVHPKYGCCIE